MSRLRLLIFDANIVIYLHQIELWKSVLERCDISLARTVAEHEVQFFERDGARFEIDLLADIKAGRINLFDVLASEASEFLQRFDPVYLESLDPGETESLAFLARTTSEHRICSADKIVFRVLPHLGMTDRGVSLEEVLTSIGLGRSLPFPYTKEFRIRWTRRGEQDWMTGLGLTH